ncbi:hypothetical protein [Streptomyces orinoci]|uniref:Secreted protein n=1 Tax=Streptomyces orinoci TaxID=67339 RepID=A0ABV3JVH1_STRON|nr:hypothetical protein [Streptomyces orinoci]
MRIRQVSRVLGPLALLLATSGLGAASATAAPRPAPQPVTDVQCIEGGGQPKGVTFNWGAYTVCSGGVYDGKVIVNGDDDDDWWWWWDLP